MHHQSLGRRSRDLCLCLCALGVGLWITYSLPSYAQANAQDATPVWTSVQLRLLESLRRANIIYLGETHDSPADHQAQLAIIQALHRENPRMAIALEMFQRPYQSVLEEYLSGTLSEAELLEQTEYRQRWGYDWRFYQPIVAFAKSQRLPLWAINTPTEMTRKVARLGLEALGKEDFRWIPPRSEIDLSSVSYRKRILETYKSFHQGKGNSDGFERFLQAQVLWDETMAEAIAQAWLRHPDRQIVVLVGQGHLLFGEGIPNRVARRLKAAARPDWKQYSVLINPPEAVKRGSSRAADFFWFSGAQP